MHISLLSWVLNSSFCSYNTTIYHQEAGTAMGTPVAVIYANIVLFMIEFPLIKDLQLSLYTRFIDDITIIATEHTIRQFITSFNNVCPSIQLDEYTVGLEGNFLDLHINVNDKNTISTKLYSKEINNYQYITPSSHHSRHVLSNFMINEFHRHWDLNSTSIYYIKSIQKFVTNLLARDYKLSDISTAFTRHNQRLYNEKLHPKVATHTNPIVLTLPTKPILELIKNPAERLVYCQAYQNNKNDTKSLINFKNPPNLKRLLK